MRNQDQLSYKSKGSKNTRQKKKYAIALIICIIFVIMILAGAFFANGTIEGFFRALIFEIVGLVCVFLFFAYKTDKMGKQSVNVKKRGRKLESKLENAFHAETDMIRTSRLEFRPIKKNFNWIIKEYEKSSSTTGDLIKKTENKQIEKEKYSRFAPYRSPFERINPPHETDKAVGNRHENKIMEELVVNEKHDAVNWQIEAGDPYQDGIVMEDEVRVQDEVVVKDRVEAEVEVGAEDEVEVEVEAEDEEIEDKAKGEACSDDNVLVLHHFKNSSEVEAVLETKTVFEPANGFYANQQFERKSCSAGKKAVRENTCITPPIELLRINDCINKEKEVASHTEYNAKKLVDTLASFGVGAKVINISKGPTVTRYELQPNVGVKVSKIVSLADDIALNLAAVGVRIEAPIPGKAAVGIEVPNNEITSVFLRDVLESEEFLKHPSKTAFAVGKDIAGNTVVADIARMPHLLIAGATGSGKSVCINTLIASILYKSSPSEVKLLMVDPKVVELSIYNGIPHLLIPVVTDPKKAAGALSWAVVEMTNRYRLFAENNVRDLDGYNELVRERGESILPQIVIIIDELADLMMVAPNEVEDCICRLAQMARAAGMHLVIATQRPSVDVITGVIKANIPSRISFAVSSQIDSRTILDMAGAEKLLGRGDMLFSPIGSPKPIRVQGAFISDKEVEGIVSYIKSIYDASEEYDQEILQKIEKQGESSLSVDTGGDDELLNQAIELVIEHGQASTSLIQRKLKVGYARAARILDQMEAWGVVGPSEGSKPRQVKVTKREWEELNS